MSDESVAATRSLDRAGRFGGLEVRPYQLMCILCRIGEGLEDDLHDERLTGILRAVRQKPGIPVTLRCNVDTVYGYQNPGRNEDTPEGELFNEKRDLDIVQRLGLVPGATRPAQELFQRLLDNVDSAMGICGYGEATSEEWQGCAWASSGYYEEGQARGIAGVIPPRPDGEKEDAKAASTRAIYDADVLRIRPHHLMCMACFHAGKEELAPIEEDNLFEAIDVIQKNPDLPVTLVPGCCMICPPCSRYDPATDLCVSGNGMGLRDQKKDLDVLQCLGLSYGETLPARELYRRLFAAVSSTRDICGYVDGVERGREWRVCGGPEGAEAYRKARASGMGILPPLGDSGA